MGFQQHANIYIKLMIKVQEYNWVDGQRNGQMEGRTDKKTDIQIGPILQDPSRGPIKHLLNSNEKIVFLFLLYSICVKNYFVQVLHQTIALEQENLRQMGQNAAKARYDRFTDVFAVVLKFIFCIKVLMQHTILGKYHFL